MARSSSSEVTGSARPRGREDRRRARREAMVARVRRDYFGEAGDSAMRYDVSIERVIAHLLDQPGDVSAIRHLDELMLVIACLDLHPRAWQDLECYELALLSAPRLGDSEIDVTIRVRRYFSAIRMALRRGERQAPIVRGLAMYRGERSLRAWLLDGIAAHRVDDVFDHPPCRMTGST